MEHAAREVLRKAKPAIKKNLHLDDDIIDELEASDTLSSEQAEKIKVQQTNSEKISLLVMMLQRRGPDTFSKFLEILKKNNKHLAETLQEKYMDEVKRLEDVDSGQSSENSLSQDQETNIYPQSKSTDEAPISIAVDKQERQQLSILPGQVQQSTDLSVSATKLPHVSPDNILRVSNHFPHYLHSGYSSRRESIHSVDFATHQSLCGMYTKLKMHLLEIDEREQSFASSPAPVNFDMVESLLNQLLKIEDDCYKVLGVTKRTSLLTHIIDLKQSEKQLQQNLRKKEDQIQRYAKKIFQLQTKAKDTEAVTNRQTHVISALTEENKALHEENKRLKLELLEKDKTSDTLEGKHTQDTCKHENVLISEVSQYKQEMKLLHIKLETYKEELHQYKTKLQEMEKRTEHEVLAYGTLFQTAQKDSQSPSDSKLTQMKHKILIAETVKSGPKPSVREKSRLLQEAVHRPSDKSSKLFQEPSKLFQESTKMTDNSSKLFQNLTQEQQIKDRSNKLFQEATTVKENKDTEKVCQDSVHSGRSDPADKAENDKIMRDSQRISESSPVSHNNSYMPQTNAKPKTSCKKPGLVRSLKRHPKWSRKPLK